MSAGRRILDRLKKAKGKKAKPRSRGAYIGAPSQSIVMVKIEDAIAIVNTVASPIEFLVSRGEMETGSDMQGMGRVRFHTAIRIRDLVEGARVNGIKTQSFSGMPGGGGNVIDITSYQLDCAKILERVKDSFPKSETWMFEMLQMIVVLDHWMGLKAGSKSDAARNARTKMIRDVHYALDRASLEFGYINQNDFSHRWGDLPLYKTPPKRRRNQDPKAEAQAVRPT